jgi:presequence protease
MIRASRALLPDTIYGVDSGGNPEHLFLTLTYEQFKQFHDTYYHPPMRAFSFMAMTRKKSACACSSEYLNEFDISM